MTNTRKRYQPNPDKAPLRQAIVAVLQEHGPMTMPDIADLLQLPRQQVSGAIRNARACHPEEFFRVVGHRNPDKLDLDMGNKSRWQIYAAEKGADAPRAKVNKNLRRKQTQKRYREKNKAIINARIRKYRSETKGSAPLLGMWHGLYPQQKSGRASHVNQGSHK